MMTKIIFQFNKNIAKILLISIFLQSCGERPIDNNRLENNKMELLSMATDQINQTNEVSSNAVRIMPPTPNPFTLAHGNEQASTRRKRKGKRKKNKKIQKIDSLQKAEEVKCQQSLTNQFIFPNITITYNCFQTVPKSDLKARAEQYFKTALKKKLTDSPLGNNVNILQIVQDFEVAANMGNAAAMFQLGTICEENGNSQMAMQWYILSFQSIWFRDQTKGFQSGVFDKIKLMAKEGNVIARRFILLHPNNMKTSTHKIGRYKTLIDFYEANLVEPYLTEAENNYKIQRIKNEICLITQQDQDQERLMHQQRAMACEAGIDAFKKGNYSEAKKIFFNFKCLPDACANLGVIYNIQAVDANGNIILPNIKKAAKYFEKARTRIAFHNLGTFYEKGYLGNIEKVPADLERAIDCFELAGMPNSYHDLGILLQKVYDKKPFSKESYERIKDAFERSGTAEAHASLADLYFEGKIGANIPHSDLEKAIYHLKQASQQNYPKAKAALGEAYMLGFTGKKTVTDYQTARNLFHEALESSDLPIDFIQKTKHNLGILLIHKNVGQPKTEAYYKKAMRYLQAAALPVSFYEIGACYELLNDTFDLNETDKQKNDQKAFEYYQKSALPKAKLEALRLCYFYRVKDQSNRTVLIAEISQELDSLIEEQASYKEKCYLKGIKAYYLEQFNDALLELQNALLLGCKERNLESTIKAIQDSIENAPMSSLHIQESLSANNLQEADQNQVLVNSSQSEAFPVNHDNVIQDVSTHQSSVVRLKKKERKMQKQIKKATRIKNSFIINHPQKKAQSEIKKTLQLCFVNEKEEEKFNKAKEESAKIKEILEEMESGADQLWGTRGIAHPEILRNVYKGYKGCISRTLNAKDRFVYKIQKESSILILNWKGHYE